MEEILNDARSLGRKIAGHKITQAFYAAARAVEKDPAAQQILTQLRDESAKVGQLQSEGKPIEPEDKRKLAECESQVASNPNVKTLMKTQMDYLDMMHRINAAIDEAAQEAQK